MNQPILPADVTRALEGLNDEINYLIRRQTYALPIGVAFKVLRAITVREFSEEQALELVLEGNNSNAEFNDEHKDENFIVKLSRRAEHASDFKEHIRTLVHRNRALGDLFVTLTGVKKSQAIYVWHFDFVQKQEFQSV